MVKTRGADPTKQKQADTWLLVEEHTTACEGILPRRRGKNLNRVRPTEPRPVHRRWGQKDMLSDTSGESTGRASWFFKETVKRGKVKILFS